MTIAPDMLFELGGAPVGGASYRSPFATHWFVDGNSGNGSDAFDGKTPSSAKATIDAATQLMGVGDVCYIRPQTYVVGTGHARYDECATVDLAQSDLTFIGAGYQRNNEFGVRMKASSTYCFDVSGPSNHFENIGFFVSGGTGEVILRNNGATNTQRGSDGYTFYNCNFKGGTSTLTGGQAGRIINCVIHGTSQLVIATPSVSGYNQQIRGCVFVDNNGTAPTTYRITASGAHVYGLLIADCHFAHKIPSTDAAYITLGGTLCTGLIANCYFDDADISVDTDVVTGGTDMRIVGCYDESNALIA